MTRSARRAVAAPRQRCSPRPQRRAAGSRRGPPGGRRSAPSPAERGNAPRSFRRRSGVGVGDMSGTRHLRSPRGHDASTTGLRQACRTREMAAADGLPSLRCAPTPTGVRRGTARGQDMRGVYRTVAGLIALGVLVQAAAVAGGWFGTIHEVDDGATITSDYEGNFGHALHGINGMMVIPLLGLVLLHHLVLRQDPGRRQVGRLHVPGDHRADRARRSPRSGCPPSVRCTASTRSSSSASR